MNVNNRKILVTGGAGFIGSHLVDRLIREGYEVVVVDNLSSGKKENVNPKAKFYNTDILDKDIADIFQKEKPGSVFHFAAHIEARESVKDPVGDATVNILGSLIVLENCRKFSVKKILFASSGGEIYGEAKKIPTPEDYVPQPISPYGVAKLTIEKYLYSYHQLFKLPYAALRYGNVYGPRQNPNGEAGVVAIFADKMLKGESVVIHGNGKQTKDYIFIDDAIEATIKVFQKDFTGVINIATGKETSVMEIFHTIKKLTKSNAKAEHVSLSVVGFKRCSLSVVRIQKEFNWQPNVNMEKGLKITVRWFKSKNNYTK